MLRARYKTVRHLVVVGLDNVVGTAPRYGMDGPVFEPRGRRGISEASREAHTVFCKMSAGSSFTRGKAASAWR
jgi:hypothetical protein